MLSNTGIVIGALVWAGSQAQRGTPVAAGATMASADQPAKPEDAVLVFGSTGKLGRLVVKQVRLSVEASQPCALRGHAHSACLHADGRSRCASQQTLAAQQLTNLPPR